MTLKKKVICINRPEDFKMVYYRMAVQQNFMTMEAFYISAESYTVANSHVWLLIFEM